MKPFGEILKNTFGTAPVAPEPVAPPPPPEPPKPRGKTVGDPFIAAEAQRIFNPGMPPTPPKPPAAGGVAQSLDVSGTWGAPEAKG
jgi:hypothetical protein